MAAPTATAPVVLAAPEARARGGHPLGWWGMVCLIGTEAMLFALLLFANFYLRMNAEEWPLGGIEEPELLKSGIRSAILFASTIPAVIAERAAKRGARSTMLVALGATFLMGALFLAGHVQEYRTLWDEFTPSTNAYGSIFYTITTFHALHLTVGLVVLAFLAWRAFRGVTGPTLEVAAAVGILYWHFVDAVWVAVYTSLYLSVRWW